MRRRGSATGRWFSTCGTATGYHLCTADDIAEILTIHRRGYSPCDAVRDLIDTRVAEITAAIADLRALRRTLIHARDAEDCSCPTEQVCAIVERPRDKPAIATRP